MSNPEKPSTSGGLLPEAPSSMGEFPPPHPGPPPQQVYGYESAQASYPGQPQYQQPLSSQDEKSPYYDQKYHDEKQPQQPQQPRKHQEEFPPSPALPQKQHLHHEQGVLPPPEKPQKQHQDQPQQQISPPPLESPNQHDPSAEEEKKQLQNQQHQDQHQQQILPPPPKLPSQQYPSAEEEKKQLQEKEKLQDKQHQESQYPPPPGLPHQDQPQQQFPPPPPGLPPQKQDQQQQYFPPPPELPHHQQQAQSPKIQVPPQQTYSIPVYNPASPVFAPPPKQSPSYQQSQADHHNQGQQAPPSPNAPHGTSSSHSKPKHSWGERFSQFGMKAASPINSLAHKLGSQSFLPETMDKECDKAAAILKAFCKKGVYVDSGESSPQGSAPEAHNGENKDDAMIDPTTKQPKNRVIVTIPPKVISKAVGLAIFTTLRAGYGVSGATGSGVLIARLADGNWGPPSGIQLHSLGGGFQIGLDIYDCVCVINTEKSLQAFMDARVSLGSDMAVVAGPYGAGAGVDFAVPESKTAKKGDASSPATAADAAAKKNERPPQQQEEKPQQQQKLQPQTDGEADENKKGSHRRGLSGSAVRPVFSYVKSRGLYAGVSVDGTIIAERKEANAAFYGRSVSVQQILKGQVPAQGPRGMWPDGAQNLFAVLRGAEAGAQMGGSTSSQGYSRDQQDEAGASPPAYNDDGHQPVMQDVKYR